MRVILMMILAASMLLAECSANAATAVSVGIVKSIVGKVEIARNGGNIAAQPNLKLYEGDVIRTGSNGKAGLILEDDTVISMGRNSRLAIEDFAFEPENNKFAFIVRVFQGTVSFVCGQINKLAPDLMKIKTPHATVGVRGTHVLIQVD